MRDTNATARDDSTNWNYSIQGRAQPSHTENREIPEPQTTDINDQAGYSREATAMATVFKPLNRSMETFLTRLCRISEYN